MLPVLEYLSGIALGLSLTAPPGPVNSIISVESIRSRIHGSSVGLGAMTADFIFFLIVYSVGRFIPKILLDSLYIAGSLVMFYFAYSVFRPSKKIHTGRGNYIVGLTVGITNPFQIIWWMTAGLFLILRFSIFSVAGLFTGIVLWIILFPFFINRYAKNMEKYIRIFSSIVLAAFGIYILASGVMAML